MLARMSWWELPVHTSSIEAELPGVTCGQRVEVPSSCSAYLGVAICKGQAGVGRTGFASGGAPEGVAHA